MLKNATFYEYVALEQKNNRKYEFHNGDVYDNYEENIVVSVNQESDIKTKNQTIISINILRWLSNKLKGNTKNYIIGNDLKIHIESFKNYLYPQLTIVCEQLKKSETYKEAITNPSVIIEVLSKSTESYDRGDKFYFYQQIESFRTYILINQYKAEIDIYQKTDDGAWIINRVSGLESNLKINILDVEIDLSEIYRNVEFEDNETMG